MSASSVGILGGGQLGSLLAVAAKKLNIRTSVYSDDKFAPAVNFSDMFFYGKYNDEEKINEFLNGVDIVTFEFENIPYETLNKISKIKPVLPNPKVNRIVQNRLFEKDFLNKCNIRTTNYVSVKNDSDLKSSANLIPGILKTCTMGYDGKVQFRIEEKNQLSIVISRFGHQKYEIYEPIENKHEEQILKYSKIPAEISEKLFNKSSEWAAMIAEELNFIGTLCVEFFIDKNDNLYVNEIAPRVHNSGHLTINTHNISQFENHIRAICGLEKVETKKLYNGEMINLIGEDINLYKNKQLKDNEFFFDYLKKEVKKKRKMGHLTIIQKT
jgi:5-(carboxyamino)imidazole ribonucleotide synthase